MIKIKDLVEQIGVQRKIVFVSLNQGSKKISEKLVAELEIEGIVLGFPKNMNNTIGPKGELSLEFKEKLEKKVTIPVYLQDERLSTREATNLLIQNDTSRKKRKKVIDSMAATIILQSFLDKK